MIRPKDGGLVGQIPFRLLIGTRIPSRTLFETGQFHPKCKNL
ncbi:MAG: hypothetical protein Q8L88_15810 [Bacteroidota bacterium]|nr:hypothetical protein [Bacteroidota bacterium]